MLCADSVFLICKEMDEFKSIAEQTIGLGICEPVGWSELADGATNGFTQTPGWSINFSHEFGLIRQPVDPVVGVTMQANFDTWISRNQLAQFL